ncbi:alpha/beta hydrolase [Paenibacillus sp. FSL H7-0350]|uniref:alpha/beta fold hydrolase n=1 Tax=Paenibacillus sp. FSL H7-0350 TaxID=2975345 RepID=UPI0031583A98
MPIVDVNGTTLYYEISGSGLPIVFIHDYSTSHHLFEPQAEYFSKRAKVIVYDLRGNGLSGKMNVEIGRILDTQVEDLKALLDKLDVEKIVIVACSTGAILAQKFAYLFPERVITMIWVDSYFQGDYSASGSKLKEALQFCAWISHYLPAEMFIKPLRITYHRWLLAYHILRKELMHKRTTEWIKQRMALKYSDGYGFALRLQIPVLIVSGNHNERVLEQVKKTAAKYPKAHLAIIENAMYPSHLCQPQLFNRLLLDYLKDQQCFQQELPG